MSDEILARRLQEYARHCFDLSSSAIRDRGPKTCLSASMLAQATHFTLLGMVAFVSPIEDDVDEPPQSLLHLARQIAYAEIHAFQEWELEMLAYLDIIHTKPVSRVLLPEQLPQGIYSNVYVFVDRLIGALHDRIKQKG